MQLNEEMAGCISDPVSALISSLNSYVALSELYLGRAPPPIFIFKLTPEMSSKEPVNNHCLVTAAGVLTASNDDHMAPFAADDKINLVMSP